MKLKRIFEKKYFILTFFLIMLIFLRTNFIYLKNIEIIKNEKYSDINFAYNDIFLLFWYLPLFLYFIIDEIGKYYNSNYISRFDRINKLTNFFYYKLSLVSLKFVVFLTSLVWLENNIISNYWSDIFIIKRYLLFVITMIICFISFSTIYLNINILFGNFTSLLFCVFILGFEYILSTSEYGSLLILRRMLGDFNWPDYYNIYIKNIIYYLVLFFSNYILTNIILKSIDIKKVNNEK